MKYRMVAKSILANSFFLSGWVVVACGAFAMYWPCGMFVTGCPLIYLGVRLAK